MSRLRRVRAACAAVLLAAATLPALGAAEAPRPGLAHGFVAQLDAASADQPLLGYVHAADVDAARAARDEAGLVPAAEYEMVAVVAAVGTPSQWQDLTDDARVTYLELDRELEPLLDTARQAVRHEATADAAVVAAAGTELDGSGVGIAVIDSGVDGTHPMFMETAPTDVALPVSRVRRNMRNACVPILADGEIGTDGDGSGDQLAADVCMVDRATYVGMPVDTDTTGAGGHGTHVASIAAGHAGAPIDGEPVEGYAPGADVYGLASGGGLLLYGAVNAMAWIAVNHADPCAGLPDLAAVGTCAPIKVTNHSYGALSPTGYDPNAIDSKLQDHLVSQGVTVVWAAGNSGGDGTAATTNAPGTSPTPGVLGVANYFDGNVGSRDGTVVASSSRGLRGDTTTYPDIAAPGHQITAACRATLPICSSGLTPLDPDYGTIGGTSMAAPSVAGIVALLLQADATLTPAEIEDALEDTARKITTGEQGGGYVFDDRNPDSGGTSLDTGHGLVDVRAALERVLGLAPQDDDGGVVCGPRLPVLTDPAGDATAVLGNEVLPVSNDSLDVRELSLATSGDGTVTFTLTMEDLAGSPLTDSNGEYIDVNFTLAGQGYYVQPVRTFTDGESFTLGRFGELGRESLAELSGSFDPDADTITVVLPQSVPDATGAEVLAVAEGDVFASFEVVARREYAVLVPDADSATGTCSFSVGQDLTTVSLPAAPIEVPEGDTDGAVVVPVTVEPAGRDGESVTVTVTDDAGAVTSSEVVDLAGATGFEVTVPHSGDTVDGPGQTFTVALADPVGVRLGTTSVDVVVRDDDDPVVDDPEPEPDGPTVTVQDTSIREPRRGGRDVRVTVLLSAPSDVDVVVTLATVDGTAVAGEDYVGDDDLVVTIPAGRTRGTALVTVLSDDTLELEESFTVEVVDVVGAVWDRVPGTVTIR